MTENKWSDLFGAEWEYILKLGSAITDPHDKKEFWENIKARKLANGGFSIYELFPRSESATKKAMRECCDGVFKRKGQRPKELPKEETEMQKFFGEIVDLGGHKVELCLWPKRNRA